MLDLLATLKVTYRIVAIDLVEARKKKILAVYQTLPPEARGKGEFVAASPEEAKKIISEWTGGVGANGVLEVCPVCSNVFNFDINIVLARTRKIVGNNPALALAYDLIRPFGAITSVGVHQSPPVPFTGRQLYNKNVAIEFGRCPVRTVFPFAANLLGRRQDIFGPVGGEVGLVERVVGLDEAPVAYEKFSKGEWGKVVFDAWL